MELNEKNLVFIALLAASVLLWSFFFNASNLVFSEIIKFGAFNETIASLTSINFILFLVFFPLSLGLAVITAKQFEKREAQLNMLAGIGVGLLISGGIFSNLIEYWIIGLGYLFSFWLIVEMIKVREKELQKFATIRISRETAKRSVSVLAVALFIFSVLSLYPANQENVNELEESMLGVAMAEEGGGELVKATAEVAIESQSQLLETITASPIFQQLKEVQDPKAQNFALALEEMENEINSPEFKEKVLKQMEAKQAGMLDDGKMQGIFESMKEEVPIYGFITNYLWLVQSIVLVSMFSFIANIVFAVMTVLYGLVLEKAIPLLPGKA